VVVAVKESLINIRFGKLQVATALLCSAATFKVIYSSDQASS
jgi:hypothetical protein